MPCERAEQALSCSVLEDMHVHAPIEIMMTESTGGYLFICLRPTEPVLRTRGSSGATLRQKVGAGAQVTGGGPGGTPNREAGAGATRTRGSLRAAPSREAGVVVLT
jgi:hypothetical protein